MNIGTALLHFLGGDEDSKGLAGGIKQQVVLEQEDNREIVRQTVSDVVAMRRAEKERRNAIIAAHEANIDALRNNGFNFENAVSIAAAGQTDNYIKYANEHVGENKNDLWKFTGNIAELSGLTTREVAERLTGPLMYPEIQYGNLKPSSGILGKMGIAPNIGKQIKEKVDMLAPTDPRDAEMKKLLVSGAGTEATAALEARAPSTLSINENINRLLTIRGAVDNPEIIDPDQIQQGKLNDDQFALLKTLMRIDQMSLGIVQQTQIEGSPTVNAFAAAIDPLNDKLKAEAAKSNPNQNIIKDLETQIRSIMETVPAELRPLVKARVLELNKIPS